MPRKGVRLIRCSRRLTTPTLRPASELRRVLRPSRWVPTSQALPPVTRVVFVPDCTAEPPTRIRPPKRAGLLPPLHEKETGETSELRNEIVRVPRPSTTDLQPATVL